MVQGKKPTLRELYRQRELEQEVPTSVNATDAWEYRRQKSEARARAKILEAKKQRYEEKKPWRDDLNQKIDRNREKIVRMFDKIHRKEEEIEAMRQTNIKKTLMKKTHLELTAFQRALKLTKDLNKQLRPPDRKYIVAMNTKFEDALCSGGSTGEEMRRWFNRDGPMERDAVEWPSEKTGYLRRSTQTAPPEKSRLPPLDFAKLHRPRSGEMQRLQFKPVQEPNQAHWLNWRKNIENSREHDRRMLAAGNIPKPDRAPFAVFGT